MTWENVLDEYGELVYERLNEFFSKLVDEKREYHPFIGDVYSELAGYVLRKGGRLASCSTFQTYKGYKGGADGQIMDVCVGVELFRHSILIHDDMVDRDELRRGGKSFHKLFSNAYDDRFADVVTLFIGNATYALALKTIRDANFPREKTFRVLQLFENYYCGINESQVLDVLFEYKTPDFEEWCTMASKRASVLFKATILTGAILGGAPEGDLHLLKEAADHIGHAFDIQDDIIDAFASEEQYGRSPGGDLMHGKKPLYLVRTIELADEKELETLNSIVGRDNMTQEELETARRIIRESGGLEAAREESIRHGKSAEELIARTNLSVETKKFLYSFTTYVEQSLNWYK